MNFSWNKMENKWRRQLLAYAKGKVLELGAGVGNNFRYYPIGVSVTATDMSARILEKAKSRAGEYGVKSAFIVSSVEKLVLPEKSFDTIVCTFFLSALDNPEKTLWQIGKWCKPGGNILILDYGLSRIKPVSWLQREWEKMSYRKTGCLLSRDLLKIFSDINLQLKGTEAKFLGTVYLIRATSGMNTL
ncbi:MAG: class I SAM-dependent methyltransferase [Chitinophagaceae bacterium]